MEYAATFILKDRLLAGLDPEYNVVDSEIVANVLCKLEQTLVTKEALEITRLGKIVNDLRKKTNDRTLASRAKDLVKKWRNSLLPEQHSELNHIEKSKLKRKRTSDVHNQPRKYPKYESQIMPSATFNNYEQTSDGQTSTKSCSSPNMEKIEIDLSSKKLVNDLTAIKYSAGLPTIFLNRFYKERSQSCSPVDDDQQSSASSNSCSPPLIFQRTRFHRSYPSKVDRSKETGVCPDRITNDTCNALAASNEIIDRKLHFSGCVSDRVMTKDENALSILANDNSTVERSVDPSDRNKHDKERMNEVRKPTDVRLQKDSSPYPEVLLKRDTIKESSNVVPSSPIRLRSHTKIHSEEDILKRKIKIASRVGKASKVRTTEEIVQDMTRVRLPTLHQAEKKILHLSNVDNHCQVTTVETDSTNTLLKDETSTLCVEVEAPETPIECSNYDLESSEKVIEKTAEEEILARLPYIDASKILAEMQAEIDEVSEPCYSKKKLISKQISVFPDNTHSENDHSIEGITGNYSFDGKFKRWNEIVSKHSYNDDLLHLLPYTVID